MDISFFFFFNFYVHMKLKCAFQGVSIHSNTRHSSKCVENCFTNANDVTCLR